jgi:Tfp pilus assembly protein PilZ
MSDRTTQNRGDRRVPVRVPVRISTLDAETDPGTGSRYFRASQEICTDVSRGGAFVRTAEPLETGRRLLLELELPGGRAFEAIGRVAWTTTCLAEDESGKRGVGIQFLGSAPGHFTTLESYLERARARGSHSSASSARPGAPKTGATAE